MSWYRGVRFLIAISLFFVLLSAEFSFLVPEITTAGVLDAFSGWAWSDNIGWISFNCTDDGSCGTVDYGVNEGGGQFSGWAWSERIGWISFNAPDVVGCPGFPPCHPRIVTDVVTGARNLMGWARACAGTVNGDCTGGSRTDGWDGWISLNCRNTTLNPGCFPQVQYGVSIDPSSICRDLTGFAWGSDVVGWISFKTNASDVNGVAYQVEGQCPQPPLVVSCEADPNPGFVRQQITWTTSHGPTTNPYTYDWTFYNATGGVDETRTTVDDNVETKTYDTAGKYTLEITVTDSSLPVQTDTATCEVTILRRRREDLPAAP